MKVLLITCVRLFWSILVPFHTHIAFPSKCEYLTIFLGQCPSPPPPPRIGTLRRDSGSLPSQRGRNCYILVGHTRLTWHVVCISITTHGGLTTLYVICVKMPIKRSSWGKCNSDTRYKHKEHMIGVDFVPFPKKKTLIRSMYRVVKRCKRPSTQLNHIYNQLYCIFLLFTAYKFIVTK